MVTSTVIEQGGSWVRPITIQVLSQNKQISDQSGHEGDRQDYHARPIEKVGERLLS